MSLAALSIATGHSLGFPSWLAAETLIAPELYPAPSNHRYKVRRPVTLHAFSSVYNNFYEFGSHKRIYKAAQKLPLRPWSVVIDGEAHNTGEMDVEDLIRAMPLEERIYRHRCIEAWSMVIPWTGFPLKALVERAQPKSTARFLRMESFFKPSIARSQKQRWYPWPYTEGITLEEAVNELAFLVTGAYGRPLEKQFGAPLRLALPWKYGIKSIKSIVRFSFVAEQPVSFWESVSPEEYGFWANVNPYVPHPRWSQRTERPLGTKERIPTKLFNGYAEYVSHMYTNPGDPKTWR